MAVQKTVLLIDDDPLTRARARQIAPKKNIALTVCGSLRELNPLASPDLFDVAVVDYYLDGVKEHLRGTDVATLLESTPVILISSNDHCVESNEAWPTSVRKFLNKSVGIDAILDEALKVGESTEEA